MTEKEKCFSKNTYFEEQGALHAIKLQPDKTHYKCNICNFWHLTTANNGLTRKEIARDAIRQNVSVVIKSNEHFVCCKGGNKYYVVFRLKGMHGQRRELVRVERIDKSTLLPKKVRPLIKEI